MLGDRGFTKKSKKRRSQSHTELNPLEGLNVSRSLEKYYKMLSLFKISKVFSLWAPSNQNKLHTFLLTVYKFTLREKSQDIVTIKSNPHSTLSKVQCLTSGTHPQSLGFQRACEARALQSTAHIAHLPGSDGLQCTAAAALGSHSTALASPILWDLHV